MRNPCQLNKKETLYGTTNLLEIICCFRVRKVFLYGKHYIWREMVISWKIIVDDVPPLNYTKAFFSNQCGIFFHLILSGRKNCVWGYMLKKIRVGRVFLLFLSLIFFYTKSIWNTEAKSKQILTHLKVIKEDIKPSRSL